MWRVFYNCYVLQPTSDDSPRNVLLLDSRATLVSFRFDAAAFMSSCTTAFKRSAKHYRHSKNQTNIIGIDLIDLNWKLGRKTKWNARLRVCLWCCCLHNNFLPECFNLFHTTKGMDWWGKEVQNLQNGLKQSASKQKTEYIYLRRYNKNQTHKFTYFLPFGSQQFLNSAPVIAQLLSCLFLSFPVN